MFSKDAIALTRKLIAFNTVNPPGDEAEIARFIGSILTENGFFVDYIPYEDKRLQLVAEKGVSAGIPPLVFTGHFDTVPLGAQEWSFDPFGGEIKGDQLYGRGSSDMKGGLAAMIIAAIQAFQNGEPKEGIRLIFTAAEESGCHGAKQLVKTYDKIGQACGIVVGEPTANLPATGHKGAVYLNMTTSGKTAHSSMPHLGDNAIYKAARAILKVEKFDFCAEEDPLLGWPTVNVGKISGGLNLNSVPDFAGFTVDARTTTKVDHEEFLSKLKKEIGVEVTMETLVNLKAVTSNENDPFVQRVYAACGVGEAAPGYPKSLPYLTDGSVLQGAYGGVPTVILGPGQPEMAHQTNEFCSIAKLEEAVSIYRNIILNKGKNHE